MLKKITIIFIVLLTITIIAAGCQPKEADQNEVYSGTVEFEQTSITVDINGFIEKLAISEGDRINKGMLVATIDPAENSIKAEQAAISVEMAKNEQERVEESALKNKDWATENAELGVQQAKLSQAVVDQAMRRYSVISRVDGIVDTVNYTVGEYAAPGSAIATLINPDKAWVTVYVPESTLPLLKQKQQVSLSSPFVEGGIKGVISNVSSKAEYTPLNIVTKKDRERLVYAVKVEILDHLDKLKAGMLLDLQLH